jgi:biopolymer transport protein TolR
MGMGGSSNEEYNSEINVTPMVDIMLVLLIIFMIVTPLIQQGVVKQLPNEMISPEEDPNIVKEDAVVVSIPDNETFYIGKEKALSMEVMGEKIKKLMEGKTPDKRIVYIKSDVNVGYGTVVQAINVIRKQDIDKIGLVANRKKGVKQEQK